MSNVDKLIQALVAYDQPTRVAIKMLYRNGGAQADIAKELEETLGLAMVALEEVRNGRGAGASE